MSAKIVLSAAAATLVLGAALPAAALADTDCTLHPKAEWRNESEARAKFQKEGYAIRRFKIDDNCYKIEGTTKDGRKAEVKYDPKTLEVVKSEIGGD